jgi:hypothetical protein
VLGFLLVILTETKPTQKLVNRLGPVSVSEFDQERDQQGLDRSANF